MPTQLRRVKNVTYLVLGALGIGINVLWATGLHPVDRSDAFLSRVDDADIGFASRDAAIRRGHLVCSSLAAGQDGSAAARDILSHSHLSTRQAGELVAAAVSSYCPQYQAMPIDQP